MKKIITLLAFLIITISLQAQFTTLWERNSRTGAADVKPTWFGTGTERGLAYGDMGSGPRLYVLSRNGSNTVKTINAFTGADIDPQPSFSFDVTGQANQLLHVNDIEMTSDNVLIAASVSSNSAGTEWYIHVATSEGSAFTRYTLTLDGTTERVGDKITVLGSWTAGTVEIWTSTGAQAPGKVYVFKTTNQGTDWTKTSFSLSGAYTATVGNSAVAPLSLSGDFYITGNGAQLRKHNSSGVYVSNSLMSNTSSSKCGTKHFNFGGNDYLVSYGYRTDPGTTGDVIARTYIYDVTIPASPTTFGVTPLQGDASAGNAINGDTAFRNNGDGTFTVYVLGTDQGIGAYRTNTSPLNSPVIVDGNLSDANYISMATKQNSNEGFGADINVSEIVYYPDVANSILYLGVKGKLDVLSANGIGIWLDFSEQTGVSAGSDIGGAGGHYMSSTFYADFEVDYMLALNPGSSSNNCYVDAKKLVGGSTTQYLGNTGQSGISTYNSASDFFSSSSIELALNNSGTANTGFEISIPFSELGVTSAGSFSAYAIVVSSTGFFSDVSVPGNISGNPGFSPNFNTNLRIDGSTTIGTGPYHSSPTSPLPVELTSFTALPQGEFVNLTWETATEVNNYGFEIERTITNSELQIPNWENVGFVEGHGNSNSVKQYSFTDNTVIAGQTYSYRLKQIDFDGQFEYSSIVNVEAGIPTEFNLEQNYPNPFNPTTSISFSLPKAAQVNLSVYNVLGEKVAQLINTQMEAGKHTINFNASNLSTGTYIYRIETPEFSTSKKMMLVK